MQARRVTPWSGLSPGFARGLQEARAGHIPAIAPAMTVDLEPPLGLGPGKGGGGLPDGRPSMMRHVLSCLYMS